MSILSYNGSAIIAMAGKDCVGIACDTRLGLQAQTISTNFQKVFRVSDKIFLGLAGLATDVQTVSQLLKFKVNMYKMNEERDLKPETLSSYLSAMMYKKRFGPWFIEPVIAGLTADNQPFLSSMDCLGCEMKTKDFVVAGTMEEALYGMCESMYRPDMESEDLFETLSQCLLSACNRDALSGWGAVVHIITPKGIMSRTLKSRQD
uniref:Proteasome subunit beta type3 putative n=1 Tax=Albugo laibachii Nc14 TaxID=890382 RepID=F0W004_9STRA|nr:proteasome subunit beta type3 putative [Albugo laibachii Nc14]|eukprot:CCA14375.1 proteasome subunit beta type3 putative [Albugo laibachii Nc14]